MLKNSRKFKIFSLHFYMEMFRKVLQKIKQNSSANLNYKNEMDEQQAEDERLQSYR